MNNPKIASVFKHLALLSVFILMVVASSKIQATSINPVTFWNFNEGTGNTLNDSFGSNHGTLQNSPTWTTGKINSGLSFDGTNDYVNVPNAPSLNPTAAISISTWIKPTNTTGTKIIIGKYSGTNVQYFLRQQGNKVRWNVKTNGVLSGPPDSTTILTPNTWYHVVGTYDGSQAKLYVNGSLETSVAKAGSMIDNGIDVNIGRQPGGMYFAGAIDEMKIFDQALSAADVSTEYNRAFIDTTAPTIPQNLTGQPSGLTQVDLSWNASTDNVGVTGYKIYRDSAEIGTTAGTTYNDQGLQSGNTYIYNVSAYDAATNESGQSSPVTVILPSSDTTPPSVDLTFPTSGSTVGSITTLRATASDNVSVYGVTFKVDGVAVAQDLTAPYVHTLDTTSLADGAHTIVAEAVDTSQLATTTPDISVEVKNTSPRQNIVLILTDDQRYDTATTQFMPLLNTAFSNNSVKFTNAGVSSSLCCPSRASILSGLFVHNHGVQTNKTPTGGATKFQDANTLSTWLHDAGYKTALIGKYFNETNLLGTYVPPGWDDFRVFSTEGFYNYTLNENGSLVGYGNGPADYSTSVFLNKSLQFIQNTPSNQPLFLYFSPWAPHEPYIAEAQDIGKFATLPPYRPPSFDEVDVSDKPTWIKNIPPLTPTIINNIDTTNRKQMDSLQAIDRAVQSIFATLAQTGRLDNTMVIYTSDNGFTLGEHRYRLDKRCAYEECIKVPMLVYKNGLTQRDDASLVQNVDLAPTILDVASVYPVDQLDGVSMLPLLNNPATPWRTESLIENLGMTVERSHSAVRTSQYTYVEYTNGDKELYDLVADPYQLVNKINDPSYAAIVSSLATSLQALKSQ